MANLPFDQAAQRFQDNEERLNVFINAPAAETVYLTADGAPVPTLPFLLPAVEAASAAARADAIRADAGADAAWLSGDVYATVDEGLRETADERYFSVPTDEAATYLALYRNEGGVAREVKRYPSEEAVENVRIGMAGIATGLVRTQTLMVQSNGFE
ncbi:hypothetical protein ACBQ16_03650 [Halopseudomonas bauzanensis]|uniref:hypothetical protein n=1 Tax=Halopseudomonas bauzanensis TaxID=653930 RepID=UPI0035243A97